MEDIQAQTAQADLQRITVQFLASCIVLKNRGALGLHGLYAHLENCTGKAKRENKRTTNTEHMRVYKRKGFVIGAALGLSGTEADKGSNP
jgi:hypothetical protein